MEDESGGGDGTAGLGDGVPIGAQIFHGLSDFVFGDRDDIFHVSADVFEVDRADALGAEPIGERAGDLLGRELDDFALTKASLGVGGEFGFDTDDFDFGTGELDCGGDARYEASAADGGEDSFDVGQLFENFEADGTLSGDDLFVVVGRDDDVSVVGGEFFGFGFALVRSGADQDNFRAELRSGFTFDRGRVVGHDDHGLCLEGAGGIGDALGVVAAGVGDDAFFALVG